MGGPCPACGGAGRMEGARFWRQYSHPKIRRFGGPRKLRKATAFLRAMPDFAVIGAPKCGTTSAYSFLCSHPDVEPALTKEIHYFDESFKRELGHLWYRHNFPAASPLRRRGSITGEATTTYLLYPHAAAMMKEAAPGARIIVMLRDPVDRAYSDYHMMVRYGMEYMSFEDALSAERARVDSERARVESDPGFRWFYVPNYSYAGKGEYAPQLERWLACYGRDKILVETLEDLVRDPPAAGGRMLEFLGLNSKSVRQPPERLNEGRYPPMRDDTRRALAAKFEPHNQKLYELLGRDLGWTRA